jgi:hypothetical protein
MAGADLGVIEPGGERMCTVRAPSDGLQVPLNAVFSFWMRHSLHWQKAVPGCRQLG